MTHKGTIPRICETCGTPFMIEPYRLARPNGGRYCSHTCQIRAPKAKRPLEERFWEKVNRDGPLPDRCPEYGPCWEWTGALATDQWRYGVFALNGGTIRAHRLAWELIAGPIPDDLHVHHACDNPRCCRNDGEGWYEVRGVLLPRRGHLWLGTDKENNDDKIDKGRAGQPGPHNAVRGDAHWSRHGLIMKNGQKRPPPRAKITPQQVGEIRTRYLAGGITQKELAAEFGVMQSAISRILGGKRWVDV